MDPPTRGQPLYKGHGLWHQLKLLYSTYCNDSNLPPEDCLQTKDKSGTPKVSFIGRLHCIQLHSVLKDYEILWSTVTHYNYGRQYL